MKPRVFLVAPTFREPSKVAALLACIGQVAYEPLSVFIVNANPGDETSKLLSGSGVDPRVRELAADPSLFWSGTVNVGLRRVQAEAGPHDWVLLLNVDITFQGDIVSALVQLAQERPACQIGALAHVAGRVISSGIQVRSWVWSLNRHPLAGWCVEDVPPDYLEPMDFLPTRCVLFPVNALREVGFVNERRLPHYAADYEFTNRLRRHGYQPFLTGSIHIESDATNTGNDLYRKGFSFHERVRRLFSIKSQFNPRYRINYVLLAYPVYAIPTALLAYLAKTIVEVGLGGARLKKILPGKGTGISG
jgi:GT2 family glycosyltransferase